LRAWQRPRGHQLPAHSPHKAQATGERQQCVSKINLCVIQGQTPTPKIWFEPISNKLRTGKLIHTYLVWNTRGTLKMLPICLPKPRRPKIVRAEGCCLGPPISSSGVDSGRRPSTPALVRHNLHPLAKVTIFPPHCT